MNIDYEADLVITFKTKKYQKIFNSKDLLEKNFGNRNSKIIMRRMMVLSAAPSLNEVSKIRPERCHKLKGDRKTYFAVDLIHPFRLVFKPDHDPIPRKGSGEVNLEKITSIKIIGVEDYH